MADTKTIESQQQWVKDLEQLEQANRKVVIPAILKIEQVDRNIQSLYKRRTVFGWSSKKSFFLFRYDENSHECFLKNVGKRINERRDAIQVCCILQYTNGEGSLYEACAKFNISSISVLSQWIKLYTSGKKLKSTSKGREPMKPGRKTTLQERIEIAQYTIANDYNYQEASKKYQVSYQQVYSWVRKYEKEGEQSLHDRRGKSLESKPNLTEEEKLQLRIKELEHRNQYLEAENGLLKKLKEIERGMGLRD